MRCHVHGQTLLTSRFWGRGPSAPFPNVGYNMRQCLQLADCVHLGRTVSTTDRNSYGKWEGCTGKRSGIRCKMCLFLHIGGLSGPPRGGRGGGGAKLSWTYISRGRYRLCQHGAFSGVGTIVASFVSTECPVGWGMWGIFGMPLKRAFWRCRGGGGGSGTIFF